MNGCHKAVFCDNFMGAAAMAKMRRKADLPTRDCAACGRPFSWRKKWARDWENVRYCSDACRSGAYGRARGSKD
jgi:hypothetical protein